MDKAATDTTKHRSRVIADALSMVRQFSVTPEGDGKMNMHITVCLTTRVGGIFQDMANAVEGACGPLLIHTDKSKTKQKEKDEQQRQQQGETPTPQQVNSGFKKGLGGCTKVKVATTFLGSMTQEVFYYYVEHLIALLPKDHEPIILLLDGHGSRWSVPALRKLMANKVYPLFIASHTSIWAQPNNAGVNKRFHWAMEQAAKTARHGQTSTPNVKYFNEIFCIGWHLFL